MLIANLDVLNNEEKVRTMGKKSKCTKDKLGFYKPKLLWDGNKEYSKDDLL